MGIWSRVQAVGSGGIKGLRRILEEIGGRSVKSSPGERSNCWEHSLFLGGGQNAQLCGHWAEKRIGQEVKRGRAEGTVLSARQNRNHKKSGVRQNQTYPAFIAELGLKKHHNRDFKEMAEVPAEVIHETVEAARVKTPSNSRISPGPVTSRPPARAATSRRTAP